MGKGSVIIYIAIALLILFLVSRSPQKSPSSLCHRRLRLRSNFTSSSGHHAPATFDPLVAGIERRREDRQWEREFFEHSHPESAANSTSAPGDEAQPEWDKYVDAEDYLNDEERFNVTGRLVQLFPKIDIDPADGFVSEDELTEWNLRQAQTEVIHRTKRDMEIHDKNRDELVSLAEYEPPSWAKHAGSSFLLSQIPNSISFSLDSVKARSYDSCLCNNAYATVLY